jgi:transcription antitermination factor NusG
MVAAVCGNREKAFAAALRGLNIAYYLPMYAKRIKANGRGDTIEVWEPLFEGYVFLWGAPATITTIRDDAKAGKHVWDILHVVDGEQGSLIDALEFVHAGLTANPHRTVGWSPKNGDRVRVKAGPFEGKEGRIEVDGPEQRIWTILELLGSPRPVDVPADMLEAA